MKNFKKLAIFLYLFVIFLISECGDANPPTPVSETSTPDIKQNEVVDADFVTLEVLSLSCDSDKFCEKLFPVSQCMKAFCMQPEGICVLSDSAMNGFPCNDNNVCTQNDRCESGKCVGDEVVCDDNNPCTEDFCDPEKGCSYKNIDGECDDGDVCTTKSVCKDGKCVGVEFDESCFCETDEDCPGNDNKCLGIYHCKNGKCILEEGTAVVCDSSKNTDCVENVCIPELGECHLIKKADGTPCNIDDPCSEKSVCVNGVCKTVKEKDCDDNNPCTTDVCDKEIGCQHIFNTNPCEDGNLCTIGDRCQMGSCVPGFNFCDCNKNDDCKNYIKDSKCTVSYECGEDNKCYPVSTQEEMCKDDDPFDCYASVCNKETGKCEKIMLPDYSLCNDGNICTQNDVCISGECKGMPVNCDDNNPCTVDYCDPEIGCVFDTVKAEGKPCDDGNPLTGDETCKYGLCIPHSFAECTTDEDCKKLSSGEGKDLCKGEVKCINNKCQIDPKTVVVCEKYINNPCIEDGCDPETGKCLKIYKPDGTPCEDGNLCTEGDYCSEGMCVPGKIKDCFDPNPCVFAYCDKNLGCVKTPKSGPCEDGNPCTIGDICIAGVCTGLRVRSCEDGNVCTKDYCDENLGCVHEKTDFGCDDGDECTEYDFCFLGECSSHHLNKCDDKNPCTNDYCDENGNCTHEFNNSPCEDGNFCTDNDYCENGQCHSGDFSCTCDSDLDCMSYDDGNLCNGILKCVNGVCVVDETTKVKCTPTGTEPVCMTTKCNPETGACEIMPVEDGTKCDDNNVCTLNDSCVNGKCVGLNELNCEDGNPCTDDGCDPTTGCFHNINNAGCDDGDYCTILDYCFNGKCISGPRVCDCKDDVDCELVDDGNVCNGTYRCVNNECVFDPKTVIHCDPSNDTQCKKNTCNPKTGECMMKNVKNGFICDDGNPCTLSSFCKNGECVGVNDNCDDGNPCTKDWCDKKIGCVNENLPDGTECDDGNSCTTGDVCYKGKCVGVEISCKDSNLSDCLGVKCDIEKGCVSFNLPEGTPCDDGNLCTIHDVCDGSGNCAGKSEVDCDDKNPCTKDVCDPETGECKHLVDELNGAECDDKNPCTAEDACDNGVCSGKPVDCDDGNQCTFDYCDPDSGCVHEILKDLPCTSDDPYLVNTKCDANGECVGESVKCTSDEDCKKFDSDNNMCNDRYVCEAVDDQVKICKYISEPVKCPPDLSPCELYECQPQTGKCIKKIAGEDTPCQTGEFCKVDGKCKTVNDTMVCVGKERNCSDDIKCTKDTCNEEKKKCEHKPIDSLCDDDDLCTKDFCDPNYGCKHEPIDLDCNDYNECTEDFCDPSTGKCAHDFVKQNGKPCDPGNTWTVNPHCENGVCVGTNMKCDENKKCDAYNEKLDNLCLKRYVCNEEKMLCKLDETPITCSETNDPCKISSCDPSTGKCVVENLPDGSPCEDGNFCTVNDRCMNGVCSGEGRDCSDDIACTVDACDEDNDQCVHTPDDSRCDQSIVCYSAKCDPAKGCVLKPDDSLSCDDGDPCTKNYCSDGVCKSTPKCNEDNNPCTEVYCDASAGGECKIKYLIGKKCELDESDRCSDDYFYPYGRCDANGNCTPASDGKISCNDDNQCTSDKCDPNSGCLHQDKTGDPCNDNNKCTQDDVCDNGKCVGKPVMCNDFNPCTEDVCDPLTGCVFPNLDDNTPCDDFDPCTENEICLSGECVPQQGVDCDDKNPCTFDFCDSSIITGDPCVHESLPFGTPAGDPLKPCEDELMCDGNGNILYDYSIKPCDEGYQDNSCIFNYSCKKNGSQVFCSKGEYSDCSSDCSNKDNGFPCNVGPGFSGDLCLNETCSEWQKVIFDNYISFSDVAAAKENFEVVFEKENSLGGKVFGIGNLYYSNIFDFIEDDSSIEHKYKIVHNAAGIFIGKVTGKAREKLISGEIKFEDFPDSPNLTDFTDLCSVLGDGSGSYIKKGFINVKKINQSKYSTVIYQFNNFTGEYGFTGEITLPSSLEDMVLNSIVRTDESGGTERLFTIGIKSDQNGSVKSAVLQKLTSVYEWEVSSSYYDLKLLALDGIFISSNNLRFVVAVGEKGTFAYYYGSNWKNFNLSVYPEYKDAESYTFYSVAISDHYKTVFVLAKRENVNPETNFIDSVEYSVWTFPFEYTAASVSLSKPFKHIIYFPDMRLCNFDFTKDENLYEIAVAKIPENTSSAHNYIIIVGDTKFADGNCNSEKKAVIYWTYGD